MFMKGIPASSGIVVGKVFLKNIKEKRIVKRQLAANEIEKEFFEQLMS